MLIHYYTTGWQWSSTWEMPDSDLGLVPAILTKPYFGGTQLLQAYAEKGPWSGHKHILSKSSFTNQHSISGYKVKVTDNSMK